MLISFVIPCYKSEKTIEFVVAEIINTMKSYTNFDIEIILVNDSSPDDVFSVMKKLSKIDNRIISIDLAKNFGQHSALMAGYNYAKGDIVVSLDDDGQSPVSQVIKFIDEINKGYDVVIARYGKKNQSLFKNFGSYLNDKMANIFVDKPPEIQFCSFFAMKKFVVNEIVQYKNPYPYIGGLILKVTQNIKNVDLEDRARLEGNTSYTFKKLVSLWINGFTAFSVKPLRISVVVGFMFAIFGLIYGIYVIINKLINPISIEGWTTIVSLISIIGGITLIMLGLIGEYIGRIYISINNFPQYSIRNIKNYKNEETKE